MDDTNRTPDNAAIIAAAVPALAQFRRDDGRDGGATLSLHGSQSAVDVVRALPGGTCKWTYHANNGPPIERYEVAQARVDGVELIAFGPHEVIALAVDDDGSKRCQS